MHIPQNKKFEDGKERRGSPTRLRLSSLLRLLALLKLLVIEEIALTCQVIHSCRNLASMYETLLPLIAGTSAAVCRIVTFRVHIIILFSAFSFIDVRNFECVSKIP